MLYLLGAKMNILSLDRCTLLGMRYRLWGNRCQRHRCLFLRLMNQNKASLYEKESPIRIYRQVFNWFKFKLSVNYPDRPITGYSYLMDSENVDQIGKLLSAFGTGVSEFVIADVAQEKVMSNIPKDLFQEILENFLKLFL